MARVPKQTNDNCDNLQTLTTIYILSVLTAQTTAAAHACMGTFGAKALSGGFLLLPTTNIIPIRVSKTIPDCYIPIRTMTVMSKRTASDTADDVENYKRC